MSRNPTEEMRPSPFAGLPRGTPVPCERCGRPVMLLYDGRCDRCPAARSVTRGHDRQRIVRSPLDGHTTVSCECGQSWDLGPDADMTEGQTVAMRHALAPNIGDPRNDPRKARKGAVPPSEDGRAEIVAAWLKKAQQRPRRSA